MIGREKFSLLAESVSDITREHYTKRWRRWARFCASMDTAPRLVASKVGRSNTLVGFIVCEYKLLGIRHSTPTKRFFAIMFTHIAEGYDDLSPRAHRALSAIKAIELRWKRVKKPRLIPS